MNLALGADCGSRLFYEYGKGESSLLAEHMGLSFTGPSRWVTLTNIDTIVEKAHLSTSVIKLDVESAKLSAIMGAERTIAMHKPRLLVEVHHPVLPEQIEDAVPSYVSLSV